MLEPAAPQRLPTLTAALLWLGGAVLVALVLVTSYTGFQPTATLAAVTIMLVVLAWRRTLLAWPTLLGLTTTVVLLVPARRYTLGGDLPVAIEPYRILIAVVLAAWALALLVDARTRFRRTGLERPVLLLLGAIACSIAFNTGRVAALSGTVAKGVLLFLSLLIVMYFVASVVDRRRVLDGVVMLLVIGATVVALCAMAEWRTGYNVFDHLASLPLIDASESASVGTLERGARPRAYASAQHAIALGAALVMVMPLAVYLYRRTGSFAWMVMAAILTFGAMASGSRTAIVMLAAAFVVFLVVKPQATVRRLLPLLLPLLVVVQIIMPGTLGTFRAVFFPENGLLAQQQAGAGEVGSGRIADIGPSLEQWAQTPLFGQGFQTRLTSARDPEVNAFILDNQWLGMLLETGALGFFALAWLLTRAIRSLGRLGRYGEEPHSWLLTALCAAITAYATGMFMFDAFSFTQVTFLLFLLLGLSGVAVRWSTEDARASDAICESAAVACADSGEGADHVQAPAEAPPARQPSGAFGRDATWRGFEHGPERGRQTSDEA